MEEQQIRDALNAHWQASATGDANAEHNIYAKVRRIVGKADLWVTEYIITYQGKPAFTVSIMEFNDNGKVIHETQYFADPFEAPAWRKQWVEQMP
jgi:hypothetical protein